MNQVAPQDNKDKIMAAFDRLLAQQEARESKVATKEEEAEKEKNKQLLTKASTYTVDNIVNGMASLQLDFGSVINQLSEKLDTESGKLDELKRAIAVQTEELGYLRQVSVTADALHILRQEHQEKLKFLEERTTAQQEAIEKEMVQKRKIWIKEQEEFETKMAEEEQLTAKQREQEAADHQYEIERMRQIEMDEYEERKRQQETELEENKREKEKNWTERDKFLAEHQTELEENIKKIDGFEEKLKEEYSKAKGQAIQDAERQAKVAADLVEKEWEATKKGYELKIQSLQETIERQSEQITALTTQLQEVTTQAQNLALRAFSSNGN